MDIPTIMRGVARFARLAGVLLLGTAAAVAAEDDAVEAGRAILIDAQNGTVLYAKAPDATFAPGNAAKLMTLAVVFAGIDHNYAADETLYRVSEHAWRRGGAPSRNTTMFLQLNSDVAVGDLLRGVATVQANDASIALAEGFAGSEENFTQQMNALAAEIGLRDTRFVNATGLPAPGQATTVRDIARLVRHLVMQHGERYPLFNEAEITWSGIRQVNKNPYRTALPGVDGLATAFSDDGGHISIVSAVRDGRRLIGVLADLPSPEARDRATRDLMNLGFTGFVERQLFDSGETVTTARVFGGATSHVALVTPGPVRVALPRDSDGRITARVVYTGPLTAPVRKGAIVARLLIRRDGVAVHDLPLEAGDDVAEGGLVRRATDGVRELAVSTVLSLIPGF